MGRGDATDWSGSCDVAPKGRIEDSDGYPCGIKVGSLTYADSAPITVLKMADRLIFQLVVIRVDKQQSFHDKVTKVEELLKADKTLDP